MNERHVHNSTKAISVGFMTWVLFEVVQRCTKAIEIENFGSSGWRWSAVPGFWQSRSIQRQRPVQLVATFLNPAPAGPDCKFGSLSMSLSVSRWTQTVVKVSSAISDSSAYITVTPPVCSAAVVSHRLAVYFIRRQKFTQLHLSNMHKRRMLVLSSVASVVIVQFD